MEHNDPDISYCCAYWDFLRGYSTRPDPIDYGLSAGMATMLDKQCDIELARLSIKPDQNPPGATHTNYTLL